jgi:hypothetical protein
LAGVAGVAARLDQTLDRIHATLQAALNGADRVAG